ncbi:MAG TPA: hypothetical protein VM580_23955 [Labilithrix sp.]|nr:hypothetical protein [Labilithrix sp.]
MTTWRTALALGITMLGAMGAVGACRTQQAEPVVPPVTMARPSQTADPVFRGPAGDASTPTAPAEAGVAPIPARESPVQASVVNLPTQVVPPSHCAELVIAIVQGTASALGETLKAGDVLVVRIAEAVEVKGTGTVVTAVATEPNESCAANKPLRKDVVRVSATPELSWANGAMKARLQVGEKQKSAFYLGRLEGTSPVGEHVHQGTWEILVAIDAAGTFLLDGKESRLLPRQVVVVPPDTKHEWRPDVGSKLVAVQMYAPPGPERRFVALAAADKDAGAPAAGSAR